MESLVSIKENNKELYEKLFNYDCKVTYNDKVLYEGKFNEDIDLGKYNKSQIIYNFNIKDKNILILCDYNNSIDKLKKLFENQEFESIYSDAKLFNKTMNLANNLPLLNIDESLYDTDIKKNIRKYGMNFKKIYENLMFVES